MQTFTKLITLARLALPVIASILAAHGALTNAEGAEVQRAGEMILGGLLGALGLVAHRYGERLASHREHVALELEAGSPRRDVDQLMAASLGGFGDIFKQIGKDPRVVGPLIRRIPKVGDEIADVMGPQVSTSEILTALNGVIDLVTDLQSRIQKLELQVMKGGKR